MGISHLQYKIWEFYPSTHPTNLSSAFLVLFTVCICLPEKASFFFVMRNLSIIFKNGLWSLNHSQQEFLDFKAVFQCYCAFIYFFKHFNLSSIWLFSQVRCGLQSHYHFPESSFLLLAVLSGFFPKLSIRNKKPRINCRQFYLRSEKVNMGRRRRGTVSSSRGPGGEVPLGKRKGKILRFS